jgi:2,3-dihydro-2,3-dihydroxybenzoate dehydrogenase
MMESRATQVAIVTGAAGGVGAAVAQALGRKSVRVAAVDNRESELSACVEQLVAEGLDVTAVPADVSSARDVEAAVERVEQSIGPISYLVNAAGVLRPGPASDLSLADWDTCFAVNARGVVLVSTEVVQRMLRRGAGAIVTVSSNAASTPRVGLAAYAASKAAATMFTKCLGLEVAGRGIRCNVVSPGSTDTPMLRVAWEGEDRSRATLDGDLRTFRLGIPTGRLAAPADVAHAVCFLLLDESRHIVLQDLRVDGGATLGA